MRSNFIFESSALSKFSRVTRIVASILAVLRLRYCDESHKLIQRGDHGVHIEALSCFVFSNFQWSWLFFHFCYTSFTRLACPLFSSRSFSSLNTFFNTTISMRCMPLVLAALASITVAQKCGSGYRKCADSACCSQYGVSNYRFSWTTRADFNTIVVRYIFRILCIRLPVFIR